MKAILFALVAIVALAVAAPVPPPGAVSMTAMMNRRMYQSFLNFNKDRASQGLAPLSEKEWRLDVAQRARLQSHERMRLHTATAPAISTQQSVADILRAARRAGKLVVTESLNNGLSEIQSDLYGTWTFGYGPNQIPAIPFHPTGHSVETFFNPMSIGWAEPYPFLDQTAPAGSPPVQALNHGWCISLTPGSDCGAWFCQAHPTFYESLNDVLNCFPPGGSCVAPALGRVVGEIQFSGIWPSCGIWNATTGQFNDQQFQLNWNGAFGAGLNYIPAASANVTQFGIDYHFTYQANFQELAGLQALYANGKFAD